MKKLILIIASLISFTALFNSCGYEHGGIRGYGPSIDTEVIVDYVTGVEVAGSIDVEIVPSDSFRVVIVAQENIANLILIETFGDVAKVDYKPHINVTPTDQTKVIFYMPVLEKISIDGSGDIYCFEEFVSDNNLEVKINGSGDVVVEGVVCTNFYSSINGSGNIEATVASNYMESEIRGSGDLRVVGSTSNHNLRISGSGEFEGYDLYTDSTYVHISGSGDANVWAEELLDVYISGSGNVTYKGNPQLIIDTPGSGNVISWK
jgi:hypothetical protein